jgi:creatinine amidohydrolase/Fe(II)-dependent formamide hydrolase-like protein
MMVNNHFQPEHVHGIYRTITLAKEQLPDLNVHYMDITYPVKKRREQLPQTYYPGDLHAARYETSLVMAKDPDLVREDVRKTLPPRPINLVEKIETGFRFFSEIGADNAYIGFPGEATAEEGRASYTNLCKMLVEQVEAMLRGERIGEGGWYSRMGARNQKQV